MRLTAFFAAVALVTNAAQADYVWIEAEQPLATNFSARQNVFAPQNDAERDKLSGRAWIGAYGPRRSPMFAVYDITVPADGEYEFFARKFWKHGPYRVSFNNGPWLDVGADPALLDSVELRQNVGAHWTRAGTVALKKGPNRFRLESTTNDGAIAFDCFLLTNEGFTPRGKLKPDERQTSTTPGWFAWDPPADRPGSPIDLRSMNETYAGENGRILSRDGRFVHEKTGKPIRFWGVNVGYDVIKMDDASIERMANMLASRGVNLIRIHGAVFHQEGGRAASIDEAQLANVQRAVGIFKKAGIYSTLSIYFPLWLKLDEANAWPAGYKSATPFGLLFLDPTLQKFYRGWWRELLTRPDANGHALKDEPAILSLEMLNEDSLFFWTFEPYKTVPGSVMEPLERRFAIWLAARHGSAEAAVKKWNSERVQGDDPANGRVGICILWRIFNNRDARSKETAQFLYEVQRDFYANTRDYLTRELGSISLVSASNWMTADERYLLPLERASYLTGDLIDRHSYYSGQHNSPRDWMVSVGDSYLDRSALRFDPEKPDQAERNSLNPSFDTMTNRLPTMISETNWSQPNRFTTEMPIVCAAYGALQDLDAYGFFAIDGPTWVSAISKYGLMTPSTLGQFPAAAMIYRKGLVAEGPTIVDASIRLDDLLDLQGGLAGIPSRAHLVGKYDVRYTNDAPTNRPDFDVSKFDDASAKSIRSATGELSLDYGKGVLAVNAPAAQGAVGFLEAAGEVKLADCTIRSTMPYGSIMVVPLDDQPIATSRKVLVQVMSEQQNTGWQTSGDRVKTITNFGTGPLLVREFAGTIEFDGDAPWQVQPLDQNSQPLGVPKSLTKALTLSPSVPYYVLTK